MKAAVASGSIWPIWCSMREKTDSRFPKTTPSGKSRTRIWDIPGMNLRVWFSRPSIPACRWVLSIQCMRLKNANFSVEFQFGTKEVQMK